MRLDDYRDLLLKDGYRSERPDPPAAAIDQGVAAGATCEHCGHVGMEYHPFVRLGSAFRRRSYVALAACPMCGEAMEF